MTLIFLIWITIFLFLFFWFEKWFLFSFSCYRKYFCSHFFVVRKFFCAKCGTWYSRYLILLKIFGFGRTTVWFFCGADNFISSMQFWMVNLSITHQKWSFCMVRVKTIHCDTTSQNNKITKMSVMWWRKTKTTIEFSEKKFNRNRLFSLSKFQKIFNCWVVIRAHKTYDEVLLIFAFSQYASLFFLFFCFILLFFSFIFFFFENEFSLL